MLVIYLISDFIISSDEYENITEKDKLLEFQEIMPQERDRTDDMGNVIKVENHILKANEVLSEPSIDLIAEGTQQDQLILAGTDSTSGHNDSSGQITISKKPTPELVKIAKKPEPEFVSKKLKKDPNASSAVSQGNDIVSTRIKRGETLWDVAKRTGDKNPWRWTDILRLNLEKSRYLMFDADADFWFVIISSGKTLKVPNNDLKLKYNRSEPKKLAIQLMAFSEAKKKAAYDLTEKLNKDGYFAYVYLSVNKKASKGSSKSYNFYRVRIGFFETKGEGLEIAEEIAKRYQNEGWDFNDYFVTKPTYEELDGKLFNYGIQLTAPYAIEAVESEDRAEVMSKIRNLKLDSKYPYLVKRNIGNTRYAMRIGFFTTAAEAEKYLKTKLMTKDKKLFYEGRVVMLKGLMETSAGQNVNLFRPH